MIFDVDGVLTDGSLLLHGRRRHDEVVQFARRPRREAARARSACRRRSSPGASRASSRRARANSRSRTLSGRRRTRPSAFADLLQKTGIAASECGYMGDDWPDLARHAPVGFAAAPANAHPEVIRARALGQPKRAAATARCAKCATRSCARSIATTTLLAAACGGERDGRARAPPHFAAAARRDGRARRRHVLAAAGHAAAGSPKRRSSRSATRPTTSPTTSRSPNSIRPARRNTA